VTTVGDLVGKAVKAVGALVGVFEGCRVGMLLGNIVGTAVTTLHTPGISQYPVWQSLCSPQTSPIPH
jgi:hypothetical protein